MSNVSMFESIEPMDRKPMAERIATKLLSLIHAGNLKAGDKLPSENELGTAMQVSRPVIREALRGLSMLGVVESRQGGRCYVTDLSPARLVEPLRMVIAVDESNIDALYEARMSVEGELIKLSAQRVTDQQISKLKEMVSACHKLATDAVGFRVADLEFHKFLMEIAQNPFLEWVAMSFYEMGIEYRRLASETPGVIARSAKEHEEIVNALILRDPVKASEAMQAHLCSIAATTFDAMRKMVKSRQQSTG